MQELVIFGAGDVGRYILQICRSKGVRPVAFCDNRLPVGTEIDGLKVYRLADIAAVCTQPAFVIAIRDLEAVVHQLQQAGYAHWQPAIDFYDIRDMKPSADALYHNLLLYWYRQRYFLDQNPWQIANVDFVITERCSLKCRDCSNLMQYYLQPENFSLAVLIQQLDDLLLFVDELFELRVIGGEPFMNSAVYEFVAYAARQEKIKSIVLYTNGTILPDDTQMQYLKNPKVWFSISNYGELSRNLLALTQKLDGLGIGYECKPVEYWTKCSSFTPHHRTREELQAVYHDCCVRTMLTYLRGRLYPCPFIGNAMNLGAIPFNKQETMGITERQQDPAVIEKMRQEFKAKFYRPDYLSSCNYCNGRPILVAENEKIAPHVQTVKPLAYEKV